MVKTVSYASDLEKTVTKPGENTHFLEFYSIVKRIISKYDSRYPGELPEGFRAELFKALDEFKDGKRIETEFDFSIIDGAENDVYLQIYLDDREINVLVPLAVNKYCNCIYSFKNNGKEKLYAFDSYETHCMSSGRPLNWTYVGQRFLDPFTRIEIEQPFCYRSAEYKNKEHFAVLRDSLKRGLEKYEQNHPGKLPEGFCGDLFGSLDIFGAGGGSDETFKRFCFGIGYDSASGRDTCDAPRFVVDLGEKAVSVEFKDDSSCPVREDVLEEMRGGGPYETSDKNVPLIYILGGDGIQSFDGAYAHKLDWCKGEGFDKIGEFLSTIGEYLSDPDIRLEICCPDEYSRLPVD